MLGEGWVKGKGFKTFPLSPFPFPPPSELGELLGSFFGKCVISTSMASNATVTNRALAFNHQ
ncbi:hypothetical protein NSTC731_03404 [Nostoc sp. DSM 114167]